MEQNALTRGEKFIQKKKKWNRWRKLVTAMACVVVFCTTYALILPAITMEQKVYCGKEEHAKHSEDEGCYTISEKLVCKKNETDGHKHGKKCYDVIDTLICGKDTDGGHQHNEKCYKVIKEQTCGLEETKGHHHDDSCYDEEGNLICETEESDGHSHSDACYSVREELTCGKEEAGPHEHTSKCYKKEKVLICNQKEEKAHSHKASCFKESKELTCKKEIHKHTKACYSNPKADLESRHTWEKTMRKVELTGEWDKDVLAIADSQLGYAESTRNYVVDPNGRTRGYTRYGEWYGDRYGHWCAMFVSYCLHYAEVDPKLIPLNSNCQNWIDTLSKKKYDLYRDNEEYLPKPGDLIFFDWNSYSKESARHSDHIGLVYEIKMDKKGKPAYIKTIEGNSSNRVEYVTYKIDDDRIMGYGELPENPENEKNLADGSKKTDKSEDGKSKNKKHKKNKDTDETVVESDNTATTETVVEGESTATTDAAGEDDNTATTEAAVEDESKATTETTGEESVQSEDSSETETESAGDLEGLESGSEEMTAEPESIIVSGSEEFGSEEAWDESETDETGSSEAETEVVTESETFEAGTEETTAEDAELEAALVEDALETEVEVTPDVEPMTQTYEGKDYTVTVTYPAYAYIPAEAELRAEEYDKDSEIYKARYEEAARLGRWTEGDREFRLFNIGFYKDGFLFLPDQEVEPEASVQVTITLKNTGDEKPEACQVTHFGEETEKLDADLSDVAKDTEIAFETDSFSDFGIMLLAATDQNHRCASDEIAHASFNDGNITKENTGKAHLITTKMWNWNDYSYSYVAPVPVNSGQTKSSIHMTRNEGEYMEIEHINGRNNGNYLLKGRNYSTFTIDFWSYIVPLYGRNQTDYGLFSIGSDNGVARRLLSASVSYSNPRQLNVFVPANSTNTSILCTEDLRNKWIHYTFVVSGRNVSFYVLDENNKVLGSGTLDIRYSYTQLFENTEVVRFGIDGKDNLMNGYMDEIIIYNSDHRPQTSNTGAHPETSWTENLAAKGVYLLNIDAKDAAGTALAGVVYTVYDSEGNKVGDFVSSNQYVVEFAGLKAGETYTVEQTGVPDDYIVVSQKKTFTVPEGRDSVYEIGIFFDYGDLEGYDPKKEAQVVDYVNRIYDVTLSALSGEAAVNITPKHFDFVVDQSNSMLFPARLTETGQSVNLAYKDDGNGYTSSDASGNSARVEALGLDPKQMYYFIADENGTATVYALWKNTSNGHWYYQDAAYYSQAQHKVKKDANTYYQYADSNQNTTAIIDGGGCLDATLEVSSIKADFSDKTTNGVQKTYKIYTGSQYNRLTYLKFSLKRLIYQLATMDSTNEVTVTTFDKNLEACMTKTIDRSHMQNVEAMIEFVDGINTDGGTAQNLGLWHLLGQNIAEKNNSGCRDTHITSNTNNYVFLITDGALNASGTMVSSSVGSQEKDLYQAASQIRNSTNADGSNVKLCTIGLSVTNVTLAQTDLAETPTGIASPGYSFLDFEADELADHLTNELLKEIIKLTKAPDKGDIKDYISDSFYLVDEKGVALNVNDRIDLDGVRNSAGPGVVGHDENGWYVEWKEQPLPKNEEYLSKNPTPWTGKFFIKAKEDFIGGNSIDTNKGDATITLAPSAMHPDMERIIKLETPTVNVRLLPMNQVTSEETVFLGDDITKLEEKLQTLLKKTEVKKIESGTGDQLNYKEGATEANGCYTDHFTIPYAIGDLTGSDWSKLLKGESVDIEYTYDDASSHGAVGYFTFSLEKYAKPGETVPEGSSEYDDHVAKVAGEDVETYTLTVTYTAYGIGQSDDEGNKRENNVHNGAKGPGTEVGKGDDIPHGAGTESVDEIHHVHVIDGEIFITKTIDDQMVSDVDQTFDFELYAKDPKTGQATGDVLKTITVTVEAGKTEGTVHELSLSRGYYVVKEKPSDSYLVDSVEIVPANTNCIAYANKPELEFDIGTNKNSPNPDYNVITFNQNAPLSENSYWAKEKRYVYSKPFAKDPTGGGSGNESGSGSGGTGSSDGGSQNPGTHKETIEDYAWTSGTIITKDVSGDQYVKSDQTQAELDAAHTSYGILTQDASDKDVWSIEWHTWISKDETAVNYDWPAGTIISADTSGSLYQMSNDNEEVLRATHTDYGILKQNAAGDWEIEWHTWTPSGGTGASSGDSVEITFYNWRYGSLTGETIKVPKGAEVTITYITDKSSDSPFWWDNITCYAYTDNHLEQNLMKTLINGQTNRYTVKITPTTDICIAYNKNFTNSDCKGSLVSYTPNESGSSPTYTEATNTLPADTDKLPKTSETVPKWTVDTTTESADISKIPTAPKEIDVPDEPADPVEPPEGGDTGDELDGVTVTKLSAGHGKVANIPTNYKAKLPVEKVWGDNGNHAGDVVYVVLYDASGAPVIDEDGNARMLKLDSSNNWKGEFKISVTEKNHDLLKDGYQVREVADISENELRNYIAAKSENDSNDTSIKYVKVVDENGIVYIGDQPYGVSYTRDTENKKLVITNHPAYELPETGGMGRNKFTIGGGVIMILSLLLGIGLRRRRERRLR